MLKLNQKTFIFIIPIKTFIQFLRIYLFIWFQRFNVKLKRMHCKDAEDYEIVVNDQLFVNSFEQMNRQKG